ncbi:tetratricopeptide repeat protein [Hydrogenophaga sp. NFH-34]|uniref:tetratricopeptide repeat protein n=1 Tax=Hydrogenophaga sp. NFH-34 TaxID=2744446 RepID=UPI001F4133CE|nr:tetratricopeptide repeat protein [Hydrogenophaga sp. NFH-34]
MMKRPARLLPLALAAALLGGCASQPSKSDSAAAEATASGAALENAATHGALVRQMQGNGLWFASLAHIDALERRWGATSETRLMRAEALRHTDQAAASAALYQQLLDTPERAAAWRGLGLISGSQGDYARAAECFENARQIAPTDGLLLNDLGYALLMDRRPEQARLPIMQAVQLLPQQPRVRSNLVLYLLVDQRPAEARRLMDEAGLSAATRRAIEQLAQELNSAATVPAAVTGQRPVGPVVPVPSAGSSGLLLKSSLRLSQALSHEPGTAAP